MADYHRKIAEERDRLREQLAAKDAEIERLTRERDTLKEALEPFASLYYKGDGPFKEWVEKALAALLCYRRR